MRIIYKLDVQGGEYSPTLCDDHHALHREVTRLANQGTKPVDIIIKVAYT